MSHQREVLKLYRQLLRLGRVYPSKNRDAVLLEIKAEFKEGMAISSQGEIEKRLASARQGVDQMKVYCNLSRNDSAWSVSLDGGGGNLEK